jgi:hypothetical protein
MVASSRRRRYDYLRRLFGPFRFIEGEDSMKRFNPTATEPVRAVQAWQILVGAAMNRQTLTYKGLAKLMFQREAAGVLAGILGHIAFYCIDHNLPPLTSVVVKLDQGTPGVRIPIDRAELDAEREKVYAMDWNDICPPNEVELHACYKNHA